MSAIEDVLAGRARWAVEHGDNSDVLARIGSGEVAHTLSDPPFEAEAHTLQRRGLEVSALSFPPITEPERSAVTGQIGRVTRGWGLVFCQIEAAHKWQASLTLGGMTYRRTCIWVKPDAMPQFSGDRPGMGYETMVLCHAPGRSKWNGGGRVGVFHHNKNSPEGDRSGHQTQKPLSLMMELVELFTDPNDLVLDPYAGSGTTGVACLRLGRRFIGIEKDVTYHALAVERLTAEAQGLSLRDARHGQASLFGVGT